MLIKCSLLSLMFCNEGDPGQEGFSNDTLIQMSYIFKNTWIINNLYLECLIFRWIKNFVSFIARYNNGIHE